MFQKCQPALDGKVICVPILAVVDKFHKPPFWNFTALEIGLTVIDLIQAIEGDPRHSDFGQELIDVSKKFINHVQAGLPKGVEIRELDSPKNTVFSFKIHGERHNFEIPRLIDFKQTVFPKPDSRNYPVLELAVTVIEMIEAVEPAEHRSELGAKLIETSRKFLKKVQAGLPKGVEIREIPTVQPKAASAA